MSKPDIRTKLAELYPNPEEAPDKISSEQAKEIQLALGWKSPTPVYAQYGKWKKSTLDPKPQAAPAMKLPTIAKRRDPETGLTQEFTIFKTIGNVAWIR